MSRSNDESVQNPCTRWYDWNADKGQLKHFDKGIGEKGDNVITNIPFGFILLDQLSTITGFHENSNSGIVSNEVKDISSEILTVRSFKGGPIAQGLYSEIKDKVKSSGGKFTVNLYIAFKDETKQYVLGSLKLKGAGCNAWIDFASKNRAQLYKKAIKITGMEEGKKGKTVYQSPVFELADIPQGKGIEEKAVELDGILQAHLTEYFKKKQPTVQAKEEAEEEKPVKKTAAETSSNSRPSRSETAKQPEPEELTDF